MAHQEIDHTHIPARGINLHVTQVGKGNLGTVVFLHGFPEIWYSWRHQKLAVAAAGYRAIAPDCRGYSLSDQPPENEEASWVWGDLVTDVLSILNALSIPKASLVGKDFGAAARGEAGRAAAASPSMESGRPASPSGSGGASIGVEGENGGAVDSWSGPEENGGIGLGVGR